MSDVQKPLPIVTSSDRAFWEAGRRHELFAYKCLNCGSFYYPAIQCVTCNKPDMQWARVSGKGTVYTFVIYHRAYHPSWQEDIPYNVVWIKLDEGPILMSKIVGCKNEEIFIGMQVEVVFDDVTQTVSLHQFRPARHGE